MKKVIGLKKVFSGLNHCIASCIPASISRQAAKKNPNTSKWVQYQIRPKKGLKEKKKALIEESVNEQDDMELHNLDLIEGFRRGQNGKDLELHFRFEDLKLILPNGKTILSGVTGYIAPGRLTVIMGPSGAGKSTFMKILMGIIK